MDSLSAALAPLAHKAYTNAVLANADCLKALPLIPAKSVALVIIDPPYGGQTHNQQVWDVAWNVCTWNMVVRHVFRILKPGGHMIVFASGKTIFDIHANVSGAYKAVFKCVPSFYRMVWTHMSRDSARVHSHTPRSQFEDIIVYFRTGEGKSMINEGTLSKTYAFDEHVGRFNVLEFYKDDCHSKPFKAVQDYFAYHKAQGRHKSTFDYKPEALMRALIRDYSSPGHVVVDVCMRHGISAVASIMEARKFVGVEIDETSFEYADRRFAEQFMQEAVTGRGDVDKNVEESPVVFEGLVSEAAVKAARKAARKAEKKAARKAEKDTEPPAVVEGLVSEAAAKAGAKAARKAARKAEKKAARKAEKDTEPPATPTTPIVGNAAAVNAAQYATPKSGKRQKVSAGYIEDSILPNGSIVEVGTPRNVMKLRIIGREMSLEKKGARYIVEYEDGKRVSMLILPADIQRVIKP